MEVIAIKNNHRKKKKRNMDVYARDVVLYLSFQEARQQSRDLWAILIGIARSVAQTAKLYLPWISVKNLRMKNQWMSLNRHMQNRCLNSKTFKSRAFGLFFRNKMMISNIIEKRNRGSGLNKNYEIEPFGSFLWKTWSVVSAPLLPKIMKKTWKMKIISIGKLHTNCIMKGYVIF